MATVPQGQSQVVSLGPNDAIKVSTPGEAYVDHISGTPESPYASARLIKNTEPKVFGPYGANAQLRVRAIESTALYDGYTDPQPALVNIGPTTGQTVLSTGDGGSGYGLLSASIFKSAAVGPIATRFDFGQGSWMWASLVDTHITAARSPLARYHLYFSTDHSVRGGVRLLYSDFLEGPWTLYNSGGDPAAPYIIYEDIDQINANSSQQTETPSVVWDSSVGEYRMFYQTIRPCWGAGTGSKVNVNDTSGGRTGCTALVAGQATLSATSADGIHWAKDRSFCIDMPHTNIAYGIGHHSGYFNPFFVRGAWHAYGLGGGGGAGLMVQHRSLGGLDAWETSTLPLPTYNKELRQLGLNESALVSWIHSIVVETVDGLMLLGVGGERGSGPPTSGILFVAPIAEDLRTITGPLKVLSRYDEAWMDGNGGTHISWVRYGGGFAGIFLTQGALATMGLHYVR